LSGQVTQAAERATLDLSGAGNGTVRSATNFTVTGSLGQHTFQITKGEQLTAVRDRINQESSSTGIGASVTGDQLTFQSTRTGAAQSVDVVVNQLDPDVNITGQNIGQVVNFNAANVAESANVTLTGDVNDATYAVINYDGRSDLSIKSERNFRPDGEQRNG
jgi:hypothetical protein